ncbi:cysteine desulfurase sulfur acceptor subunit CsdE [Candidatus Erwinia haradaeae]|uniref:Sulfur acceptor protein CsdE n=1 Tax=Candidatus Erwinia haradaeae TaxID=1922217 RepID=A0A803GCZ3_9GAMM|nr:cysteine desulfurase sulfur acceptor subunit CsdE [Candidatus Erwinia haradaeae]VFP88836.1 Sulfur acceptor protein CsdE [Candidatus Erwinia haradaeae]
MEFTLDKEFIISHPFGKSITPNLLLDQFSYFNEWEERYRYIILLGNELPRLPDHIKDQQPSWIGCSNRMWFGHQLQKGNKLHFYGDSDARIMRGLIAILLTCIENQSPKDLCTKDMSVFFTQLRLKDYLTIGRSSSLKILSNKVLEIARNYLDKEAILK